MVKSVNGWLKRNKLDNSHCQNLQTHFLSRGESTERAYKRPAGTKKLASTYAKCKCSIYCFNMCGV